MLLLRKEKKRLLAQKNAPEMYCMHTAQPTEFHDPKLLNLTPPLSSVLNAGSCRTSTQPSGDHSMETRQETSPSAEPVVTKHSLSRQADPTSSQLNTYYITDHHS